MTKLESGLGIVLLLVAAANIVAARQTGNALLCLSAPLFLTVTFLWWAKRLYLWQRPWSYRRRERRRKEDPAEKLEIPAAVKKVEMYDGVKTLHEAQWTYLNRSVEAQGAYFANGILAAILAPLALLLLSSQLLAPQGTPIEVSIGLILSEILCLITLVYLGLTNPEPTAEWIENRTRTELFRREQYLVLAGVGPYLNLSPPNAAAEALIRCGQFEGADSHALAHLVPMQDSTGCTWLETLHRKGSANTPDRADFMERMESYLYYRIGKQLQWFGNEIRDLQKSERLWSRLLAGALLAAIVIAAIHAFDLRSEQTQSESSKSAEYLKLVIGTLAFVLPTLGTACLAIRSMYNFRGRSRIYEHEKNLLRTYKGALEALLSKAKAGKNIGNSENPADLDLEFRALALRTEQSLSFELEQWMLLMERHEHELSP
jgi:hypothetical protein